MSEDYPSRFSPEYTRTSTPVAELRPRRKLRVGATAPQPGVAAPGRAERLPHRETSDTATIWWLGVHGGAGETTLTTIAAGSKAAHHAWPVPAIPGAVNRVALVARTHYAGLIAAQRAATEWAAGTINPTIYLTGLILIADAPGRRPKILRELEQVISGGVPQVWTLPWVEAWRLGPVQTDTPLPKEFAQLCAELSVTSSSGAAHNRKATR